MHKHIWWKCREIEVFQQILTLIWLHGRYPAPPKQANWPGGSLMIVYAAVLLEVSFRDLLQKFNICIIVGLKPYRKNQWFSLRDGPIGISHEPERLEYVATGPNMLLCLRVGSENTKRAESERGISPFTLSMPTHGCPISHELIWYLEWLPHQPSEPHTDMDPY